MAAETLQHCFRHATAVATHKCRKCGRMICNACVMQIDIGLFCSMECAEAASEFEHQAHGTMGGPPKKGFGMMKSLGKLVAFVLALGLLYGLVYMLSGFSDPGDMAAWLLAQIRRLFANLLG